MIIGLNDELSEELNLRIAQFLKIDPTMVSEEGFFCYEDGSGVVTISWDSYAQISQEEFDSLALR
jgi:hypothetical protein